ncbi:hypothetical protein H5410_037025 [Solanum commersonii]|uniref:Uncharacterized protein n=1 Tax=Solanum commersonii TaxID=4109 RepID=A0A9J5Y5Z0_SOLCO|nr:hypothetical protein H5410_037025 [Solanum commersonii]
MHNETVAEDESRRVDEEFVEETFEKELRAKVGSSAVTPHSPIPSITASGTDGATEPSLLPPLIFLPGNDASLEVSNSRDSR